MFKILDKTFRTGTVTTPYPQSASKLPPNSRGLPEFDWAKWQDARPAAEVCPTGAIAVSDGGRARTVTVDYGRCIACGECAVADAAVSISREFELSARTRNELVSFAEYTLDE